MNSTKGITTQYISNTHYQYNDTSVYSCIYYISLCIGTMVTLDVTVKAKIYGHTFSQEVNIITNIQY